MTAIEQTLATRLLATAALTALVGSRIEPVIVSQDSALPALSYQRVSSQEYPTHSGPAIHVPRFQLTAVAQTYADAVDVLAACRTALDAVSWGGVSSFVESEYDGYSAQSGEMGAYVRRMDVVIWDP